MKTTTKDGVWVSRNSLLVLLLIIALWVSRRTDTDGKDTRPQTKPHVIPKHRATLPILEADEQLYGKAG